MFSDPGFRDLVKILVGFVSLDDLTFDLIVSCTFSCFVCLLYFCLFCFTIFEFCLLAVLIDVDSFDV